MFPARNIFDHIHRLMMKQLGKMNGVETIFFSHRTHHSKGVCILQRNLSFL